MPTYEYRCKDCGHGFEIHQSFADDALTDCPECSGPLRKVFGNVGISFKGGGFYKNDSRPSSKKPAAKSDGAKTDPAKSGDGGTKSDGAKTKSSKTSKSDGGGSSGSAKSKTSTSS